jgi:hypothetical protein
MKIHGNSTSAAAVLAVACALSAAPAAAQQPPAKPATPAAAKPAAKPAAAPATKPAAKPAAPAAKPAAAPAKTDAKGLFASGEKKFKAGDYAGALADFEASNAAKPSPEADRYIGLCQDNLGGYQDAVAAYERFLANVPPKMKDQAEEATKRVEAIKAMPAHIHVETVPAGATVTLDGQTAIGQTPTETDVSPGKHAIKLTAEGYEPVDQEIEVSYASKQEIQVELKKSEPPPPPPPPVVAEAPPPPPTPPPPPPPEPRSKVPAYVTGAVAIVAAGVGTGFGLKALSQSSDFKNTPTTQLADDGENNALVADMMFGIAITFGVTSAVLFLSSDTPQNAKASTPVRAAAAPKKKITVTPTPYVTPSGGGAGALVRF